MSKIIGKLYLTTDEYNWYGEEKGWDTEVIYKDEMSGCEPFGYFYSPDGVGRIWHNLDDLYKYVFGESIPIIIVRKKAE